MTSVAYLREAMCQPTTATSTRGSTDAELLHPADFTIQQAEGCV